MTRTRGRPENLKPFRKGQSGNPGGRPKGFVAEIKKHCGGDDYAKLAEGLAVIAFGKAVEQKRFFGESVKVTARDRLTAMVELRDSGPGRPAQTIKADEPPGPLFMIGARPALSKADMDACKRAAETGS